MCGAIRPTHRTDSLLHTVRASVRSLLSVRPCSLSFLVHYLIPCALVLSLVLSRFTSRSCFSAGQVNYSATTTHNTTKADGTCGDACGDGARGEENGARGEENSDIVDDIYLL